VSKTTQAHFWKQKQFTQWSQKGCDRKQEPSIKKLCLRFIAITVWRPICVQAGRLFYEEHFEQNLKKAESQNPNITKRKWWFGLFSSASGIEKFDTWLKSALSLSSGSIRIILGADLRASIMSGVL
jgi:hypothetical protein